MFPPRDAVSGGALRAAGYFHIIFTGYRFVKFMLQSMFFGVKIYLIRRCAEVRRVKETCLLLEILEGGGWGRETGLVDSFLESFAFPLLQEALASLKRDALYMSHVHGVGHIERTMLHGAMGAAAEPLSEKDARLLLTMCAYHDTGRVCDYLDGAHGARSALKLAALTGLAGEDLKEAAAGVEAHSVGDGRMEEILLRWAPEDLPRARLLAQLLKDADGLDRVRIADLDPAYLRRPRSRERAAFAQLLFDRYAALERERGLNGEAEGYDLPTIRRVRDFTAARFAEGKPCGETARLAWEFLGGRRPAKPLPEPGETCAVLTAALAYLEEALPAGGRGPEETADACRRLRERFRAQYGTERCAALKPGRGCGGFAVDAVLFAWQFITEEEKKKET